MTTKNRDNCKDPEWYHPDKCLYYDDCEECIEETKTELYLQEVKKARAGGKCHLKIVK